MGGLLAGAFTLAALMGVSSSAEAAPRVLRPGTHPWWFQGGFGPSVAVTGGQTGGRGFGRGGDFTQFMLTQEIGGHFSGDFEGPGLVAHFAEAFGGRFAAPFRFTTGPRFYYDIQVNDQYGIYIAPYGQIGYTFWDFPGAEHYFNLQFGASCHIVLADRAVVGAQLVNFDFNIGDFWWMNYSMQFFGGVSW